MQSKRLKGKSYRDAAEKEEGAEAEQPAKVAKAVVKAEQPAKASEKGKEKGNQGSPIPKRLVFDGVEIPVSSAHTSLKVQKDSPPEDTDDDSDDNLRPRRTRLVKKVIEISDDDESEPAKSKVSKKGAKAPSKQKKKKQDESSDYEGQSSGSSESESDVSMSSGGDDDDDDDDVPSKARAKTTKTNAKGKGKAKSKPSKNKSVTSSGKEDTETTDMDVDVPMTKKAAKSKKRKTPEEETTEGDEEEDKPKPAKKQKIEKDERNAKRSKRAKDDPWKLSSKPVEKKWMRMQAPPLEMFHFARKVIDEYTYLDGKIHALVTRISASRHWVLSGTPPIHDFAALKTIAAFLNLHLGVDDDGEGQSVEVKKRRREQTGNVHHWMSQLNIINAFLAVEKFHSFREVHSLEWHAHRHQVGQLFLDSYVRQVRIFLILLKKLTPNCYRTLQKSMRFPGRKR